MSNCKHRLNAYQLFFEKPLQQFCKTQHQRVLVMGDGCRAEETFKVSLVAGQTLGKKLFVELISPNAEEFGQELLLPDGKYPALNQFINNQLSSVSFKLLQNKEFKKIENLKKKKNDAGKVYSLARKGIQSAPVWAVGP